MMDGGLGDRLRGWVVVTPEMLVACTKAVGAERK